MLPTRLPQGFPVSPAVTLVCLVLLPSKYSYDVLAYTDNAAIKRTQDLGSAILAT